MDRITTTGPEAGKRPILAAARRAPAAVGVVMAFIRKRGNAYYLVHNVRREGRVQQLHLARLGNHPRISDDVVQGVTAKHPFVRIDWDGVRQKASRENVRPVENDSEFLRQLISDVRNVHLNLADLHMPLLELTRERELRSQLLTELKLLRGALDVKLSAPRKRDLVDTRERSYRGSI
ncbi:MAG: hypothetical protein ACRD1N_04755 [Terriglobia bacterium]